MENRFKAGLFIWTTKELLIYIERESNMIVVFQEDHSGGFRHDSLDQVGR